MARVPGILSGIIRSLAVEDRLAIASVRIATIHRPNSVGRSLSIQIERNQLESWPPLTPIIKQFGVYIDDEVLLDDEPSQSLSNMLSSGELTDKAKSSITLKLFNEREFNLASIAEYLREDTVFGFPRELVKNLSVSRLKIFVGASREPIDLFINPNTHVSVRSHNGSPFVVLPNSGKGIHLYLLGDDGGIKKYTLDPDKYLSTSNQLITLRYKHKPKLNFSIYSLLPQPHDFVDTPFLDFTYLVEKVNSDAERSVTEHLRRQVAQLDERLESVRTRRKVFYDNVELGIVPRSELETVLLIDRYVRQKNNSLTNGGRFKLLEYSPTGIDAIVEFALPGAPVAVVAAEFEYELRSFFEHGHDIRQVRVILCYSKGSLEFPFVHCGVTYYLNDRGELPIISRDCDEAIAYLFCLNSYIEER